MPGKDYETAVAIGSLQGKDMLLQITKKAGSEMDDVLDAPDDRRNTMWGRFSSWVSKPTPLSETALGTGEQLMLTSGLCSLTPFLKLLDGLVSNPQ